MPPRPNSALQPQLNMRGYTSIYFGENQISLSLISLSLRSTGHPPSFQPRSVRSSTGSYPRFNLPMDRSLSFGSTAHDSIALFRLAFATAPFPSPCRGRVTRWLIMQKARRHRTSRLRPLVSTRFQVLFHSPSGVLFTFPSRY